ncbi:MAG: isochorismatase family cysteine hydrolase [Dongiaceae bacterium]
MKITLPARYYCRLPYEAPRGIVDTAEELDLEQTVFLLVDVYGLGHDPGAPMPAQPPLFLKSLHERQSTMIRERIRPTLDAARAAGLPVVYTENMWRPSAWGNSEFARLCERTESGAPFDEVYIGGDYNAYSAVIAPAAGDFVVQKTMYDSFFETTLDTVLRNLGAKYLVCVGFSAEICLLSTVIGAMYRNYRVFVLRDCVLGSEFVDTVDDMAMTRWAIRYYEAMVGFTSTSDELVAALAARRSPAA